MVLSIKEVYRHLAHTYGHAIVVICIISVICVTIFLIAWLIMHILRHKQRKIDDKRTSLDLLEQGRLTPVINRKVQNEAINDESNPPPASQFNLRPFQADEPEEEQPASTSYDLPKIPIAEPSETIINKDQSNMTTNAPTPVKAMNADNLEKDDIIISQSSFPLPNVPLNDMTKEANSPVTSNEDFHEALDQQTEEEEGPYGSPKEGGPYDGAKEKDTFSDKDAGLKSTESTPSASNKSTFSRSGWGKRP